MPTNDVRKTANGHQTSILVRQHMPEFVANDHPQFLTFIEKYYEFMANNSVLATANSDVYYYGPESASRVLQDIGDIDHTNLSEFIGSFQKQYGYSFPQEIYGDGNLALLYKNLVNFYQAVGTEDSFKMLFRLIYNEDIELYYPFNDVLIASGGNYSRTSRIKVNLVDNINEIANKQIVGATSGATATVEKVVATDYPSDNFISGSIANTSISYTSGVSNNEIHDNMKFLEHGSKIAFVYLSDVIGKFKLNEEVYYSEGGAANTTVANTIILPLIRRLLMFDQFDYTNGNNVVSLHDSLLFSQSNSTFVPWGTSNIALSNTGIYHTTGGGQGEIILTSNDVAGSINSRVLQVGNTTSAHANGNMRQFVSTLPIGIRSEDTIYRMSIRARDLGGNSAYSIAAGNRFSAGVVPLRHDQRILGGTGYIQSYEDPFWFVSHKQSIDDQFYIYSAYFGGRESKLSSGDPYLESNYGNGGRVDLPSGRRNYNSLQKALNRETLLPFNTTYFFPTFKVNEIANGASFSQSVTQVDFVSVEEITAMQSQEGKNTTGAYRSEHSLLSGSSHLQDAYYYQRYAYDLRTKQQMKDYATVIRESVHPAGMKMFGTKITESTSNIAVDYTFTGANTSFSPNEFSSLAAWWRADAIGPENVDYKKYGPNITANGIYGTERNRFPVGLSSFEDLVDPYDLYEVGIISGGVTVGSGGDDAYVGKRSLEVIDNHSSQYPYFIFPSRDNTLTSYDDFINTDDYEFPIIIEPYKKWLLSFYGKTTNTTSLDGSVNKRTNAFYMWTDVANTSGADIYHSGFDGGNDGFANEYGTAVTTGGWFSDFSAENTWERKSMVIDMSNSPHQRLTFWINLPDRRDFGGPASDKTKYHFDGFMLEEYDPVSHGTVWGQHTPSPYLETGLNGGNVISWFDQSPNKHHVYANTHGEIFYTPQYIANAVGGKPAVRFSANTVKNTGNVYQYSSIGGTVRSDQLESGAATNFKPPTSGLQSKLTGNSWGGYISGTLASPSLNRPVTNTWTIMAVVRTNLAMNASSYDSTLTQTILNSGYAGNEDALSDSASALGTLNLGYEIIDETGAVQTNVVNSTAGITSVNTSAVATFGSLSSSNTESSFRIVGVSVNASTLSSSSTDDLVNLHVDGRRFANSELHFNTDSFVSGYSGMDWVSQNNYVTSIGKWAPSNNSIQDTTATGVNKVYQYGAGDWDGDIAEILVFNEKLSNTNIAKVEGYLAHKYSLQENLKHKDDDGEDGPEINAYYWGFVGLDSDGWDIHVALDNGSRSTVTLSENGSLLRLTVPAYGSSGGVTLTQNTTIQIDASAYDKFEIAFDAIASYTADQGRGTLSWTYIDDDGTFKSGTTAAKTGSAYGTGSTTTHTHDLSGESTWKGKITSLSYLLDSDSNGGQRYDLRYAFISGNNHPHPYRHSPPLTLGANTLNVNY